VLVFVGHREAGKAGGHSKLGSGVFIVVCFRAWFLELQYGDIQDRVSRGTISTKQMVLGVV
jgi:hypothetical protein